MGQCFAVVVLSPVGTQHVTKTVYTWIFKVLH